MKSLIVLPFDATAESPVLNHAVRVLGQGLPQPVDVVHRNKRDELLHGDYSHVVYVGKAGQLREMLGADANVPQLEGDAYCCKAIPGDGLVVCLAGGHDRGILYAAGEFCRAIDLGKDLSGLDIVKKPLVPVRMAYMCASTRQGEYFRPGLFDEAVEKLALLGGNGVFVIPEKEYGTSAGMDDLPFRVHDGKVVPVEPRLREWQYMFGKIKSYGHFIYVLVSAWIPPEFEKEEVRDYYDGKADIPDYEAQAAQTMTQMLSAMFEHLPQIDGVVLHSLERSVLWGRAVSVFPAQDLDRAGRVMETYLGSVRDCCRSYQKTPCFWPHAFGVDGRQLLKLRRILAQYPDIVNLEDSHWNNSGWPFLPIMGYLPDELRESIHLQNRFGLFTTSTDGEYYGTGRLPTLFPRQLYDASREAVNRQAEMMIVRLNRHDSTSLGTLNNICGVNVEASLRALWTPTPDLMEIWDEWSRLRFGEAGVSVARALQKGRDILLKGITYQGVPLMWGDTVPAPHWTPGRVNFRMFSKPGVPLLNKDYEDLQGTDFQIWQTNPRSLPIEEFRSAQNEALEAVAEGRKLIEKEEHNLTEEDYAYLTDIYDNAEYVLKAIRLVGEAAHAMNLAADNYDSHPDPVGLAQERIHQLESYAQTILREKGNDFFCAPHFSKARLKGEDIVAPSLAEELQVIAEMYQTKLRE
jgi:hypothetical protein